MTDEVTGPHSKIEAEGAWNNDNPDDVLERGKEYTVKMTELHTSHTKLIIEGYEGKFNSICFIKGEEQ